MKLDYENRQITILEEEGENFLHLQDYTSYKLCFRLRNDKYEVPLIALPILLSACKRASFNVHFTDKLSKTIKTLQNNRRILEGLKNGTIDPSVSSKLADIHTFLDKTEKERGFKLSEGQRQTIVYGIVGKKVLCGNEIGTGKSLVAVMIGKYLLYKNLISKILILVPASLVQNFYDDYLKFFGNEGILKVGPEPKKIRGGLYTKFRSVEKIHFLVTNYEKCLYDFEELKKLKPDYIVVDEFHKMRNFMSAKRSENFFYMIEKLWQPEYRLPMSGTPIEHKLFDIYPVFKLISSGILLGGQRFFESNFVEFKTIYFKIEYRGRKITKTEEKAIGFKNLDFMKGLIKPYIIRKKLILPVGKYEQNILIKPDKKLLDKYNEVRKTYTGGSSRYHACRQFLCSPERENYAENIKFEEFKNILDQTSEKIVVFSFYICSTHTIKNYLDSLGIKNLTISGEFTEDATKVIKKFSQEDYRVLICTDKVNFGQNIQCAKVLVEWDKPIGPTTTFQRIGRLYRVGQDKDVHIYSFVVQDTVEEIIYEVYESKKDIIRQAFEELDEEKLKELDAEFEKRILKEFEDRK